MAESYSRYRVPESTADLTRRTGIGVLVAVVALLAVQSVVDYLGIDVGATGAMSPFATGPLVGSAVVAGIGAAVTYALVESLTERPSRNFLAIAAAVFALMLLPVAFATPSMDVTPAGQGVLVLYHLLVAVSLVAFILGLVEV